VETASIKTEQRAESKAKKTEETGKTPGTVSRIERLEELEEMIVEYIRKRGGVVTKDDLVSWARMRGIKTAMLLRAIDSLSRKKMIVRRLCDEKLCYEVKSP